MKCFKSILQIKRGWFIKIHIKIPASYCKIIHPICWIEEEQIKEIISTNLLIIISVGYECDQMQIHRAAL